MVSKGEKFSKEDKSTLVGIVVFIIVALLLSIEFKYGDVQSLLIAGILGVATGLIANKLQGG